MVEVNARQAKAAGRTKCAGENRIRERRTRKKKGEKRKRHVFTMNCHHVAILMLTHFAYDAYDEKIEMTKKREKFADELSMTMADEQAVQAHRSAHGTRDRTHARRRGSAAARAARGGTVG